ncbi:MAG: methyltransferase domain-containing protein [Candidatus Binatia bacterium]
MALAGFVLFGLLAFGVRGWIHRRRTGTTGFVGVSGRVGSIEWLGGALFAAALAAGLAAPLLQLAGVVAPIPAFEAGWVRATALVVYALGLGGTLWAQLAMGDSWRIGVDRTARTTLVATGPFRWVRNPIYTAMTSATVGLALLAPTLVSLLALTALVAALEVQVRLVEEPYLTSTHGEAYRRYAARTGRFLPGIGRLDARDAREHFIPALGADCLTPLYDAVALLTGERLFKRRLVAAAQIVPGHDVLDLGCGTGTLALLVKQTCPGAHVVGLDIDPRILAIAHRKIERAGTTIELAQGSATAAPFPTASFDRVLTTLVLHHLTTPQKRAALAAVRRLLRPGGELHIADWGKPHNLLMRVAALGFRLVDGGEATAANLRGELPSLVADAGFLDVVETERWMTAFGTLAFVRATAPGE